MRYLPTGIVTFLFTDIEGSTRLLHELGPDYAAALADHRRALREAFARHDGVEVDTQGDAFFVAFASPREAVAAAAESQAALQSGPIRVRIGLHTGEPSLTDEGYVGLDVHKGARIAASGHGGQVIMSADTRAFLGDAVPVVELGEHRLKDFDHPVQLFQLGDHLFPPLKTISNTNLPRPVSSFIGRRREVAGVLSLLRDGARLVTLTGPGGSGKTRLGIEVAADLVPGYGAGVFWAELAPVRDPSLVLHTVGQSLGAKGGLAEHIGEREMLLLLDNFEHVVEAAPGLADVLEACSNLSLLVTSRELLRIRGEVEYAVPPLVEAEAIELFCTRARLHATDDIAELCARLDNLPLALELAAARTNVLSAAQILDRLSQRLDLFKGGRDADPRQATLRATIGWSHDLLSKGEQRLFARVAVFLGGCTLESAVAVCDAGLDPLQSLVEKSLVRRTGDRFWMLETIREYARERLEESGEAAAVGRRHFDYFLALAESTRLSAEFEYGRRHDLLLPETDNLRTAFDWAVAAGEIELGFRLAIALENFWVTIDPFEGVRRFETLFAAGGDVSPILRARALRCYGGSSEMSGGHEQAKRAYEESLALFEEVGTEGDVAVLIHRLGINALNRGKPDLAREPLERSLDMFRRQGSKRGVAQAIGGLGYLARDEGDLDGAVELWEESLAMVRDTGFLWWQTGMLAALAEAALERGRLEEATALAREQLALGEQVADRQNAVYALAYLARAAAERGDRIRAGQLWGAIEVEESRSPIGAWESERDLYEAALRHHSGAEFESGRRDGRRMSLDQAIQLALEKDEQGPA
jgi:predicted ATPase